MTVTSIAGWRHSASARGVERDPGESDRVRGRRSARSSSTIAEASAVFRLVGSTGANGTRS